MDLFISKFYIKKLFPNTSRLIDLLPLKCYSRGENND